MLKILLAKGSVINSNAGCSQEIKRRQRLRRAAGDELGNVVKSKDVSVEAKSKIIYTLVFLITTCGCENWTVKKTDWEKNGFI